MFYLDGCSYVFGHNDSTYFNTWVKFLEETNHSHDLNMSRVAKSNLGIFNDFMNNHHRLSSADKVVIYWSHSERYVDGLARSNFEMHDSKNFTGNDPWAKNYFRNWFAWIISTASYMKAVKDICLAKGINPVFLTVDHYHWFQEAEKLTKYNFTEELTPYVFNWPNSPVKMYHKWNYEAESSNVRADTNVFIFYLALTNLPVSSALAIEMDTGIKALDPDNKHLNEYGQKIFAEWLQAYIEDRSKNVEYVASQLSPQAAKCFTDPIAGYGCYEDPGLHWVEAKALEVMNKLAKKNQEFVYE